MLLHLHCARFIETWTAIFALSIYAIYQLYVLDESLDPDFDMPIQYMVDVFLD